MTEQEQLHIRIRTELARAMGTHAWYTDGLTRWLSAREEMAAVCRRYPEIVETSNELLIDWTESEIPDPFTNAADNRALVEWLLSEDSDAQFNEIVFLTELMRNYTYLWQPGKVEFNAVEVRGIIFRVLTAPLETITLAAARALGIPEASE